MQESHARHTVVRAWLLYTTFPWFVVICHHCYMLSSITRGPLAGGTGRYKDGTSLKVHETGSCLPVPNLDRSIVYSFLARSTLQFSHDRVTDIDFSNESLDSGYLEEKLIENSLYSSATIRELRRPVQEMSSRYHGGSLAM